VVPDTLVAAAIVEVDMGPAIFAFVVILTQTPAPTPVRADALGIAVFRASLGVDRAQTSVEFDLTNQTAKAVTAWQVAIEARLADGTVRQTAMAKDAYLAYEGLIPDRGDFIRPHAEVHVSVRLADLFGALPPGSVQRLAVIGRSVVFADRTWTGDADKVRTIFAERDRTQVALMEVITALRKARLTAQGTDALRAALSEMNRQDQQDPDNAVKVTMRRNLQSAIDASPSEASPPDEQMRIWLASLEKRRQVTQEHMVQGPRADNSSSPASFHRIEGKHPDWDVTHSFFAVRPVVALHSRGAPQPPGTASQGERP
jgi:hypothetical protein